MRCHLFASSTSIYDYEEFCFTWTLCCILAQEMERGLHLGRLRIAELYLCQRGNIWLSANENSRHVS